MVPLEGLEPHAQQRSDPREAAWHQARPLTRDGQAPRREDDSHVGPETSRPPGTPPTPEEADAIRTATANGESVRSIAERFDRHRSTAPRSAKKPRQAAARATDGASWRRGSVSPASEDRTMSAECSLRRCVDERDCRRERRAAITTGLTRHGRILLSDDPCLRARPASREYLAQLRRLAWWRN